MDSLRVRAYNVGFGDALLVSVPEDGDRGQPTLRHVLIDVGNVLTGPGGRDEVFETVFRDVERQLGGGSLDLYVMTHEHLDHVQGCYWAARSLDPPLRLEVRHAWLTASAEGDAYYARFPEARRRRLAMLEGFEEIRRLHLALLAAGRPVPGPLTALLANNDPRSTGRCVEHLRTLAPETTYVYRGCSLDGAHPFREAKLSVWAPEQDTSSYYRRLRRRPPAATGAAGDGGVAEPALIDPEPPAGVDPDSFRQLLDWRRSGHFENLLAIDAAQNDTSLVLLIEWRGWRLLFPGDAEIGSWETMAKAGVLRPVHFLKVAHHGSANGTPRGETLDRILPREAPDGRPRVALASTLPEVYRGVPDEDTFRELAGRGLSVVSVDREVAPGGWVDLEFPADGGPIRTSRTKGGDDA
jgi:beta-lactamase superfamily II metal-dependent hydrolase